VAARGRDYGSWVLILAGLRQVTASRVSIRSNQEHSSQTPRAREEIALMYDYYRKSAAAISASALLAAASASSD